MGPLVSVCIPTYNNSAFIIETINSVLNQTHQQFEIIIVDDCSSDNTVELIRTVSDNRITMFQNAKNLGMHGNWNKVLSLAKGEYVKLLCGDDLIYPDCLSAQIAEFQKPNHSDLVLVACQRQIIKSDGSLSFGSFYKFRPGKYSGPRAMQLCTLFGTNLIGEPMSVLLKGKILRDNQIVLGSNNYMIDIDMYAKMLKHGSLYMQKEVLAAFRIYGESMSGTLGFKQASMFREFIYDKNLSSAFNIHWYQQAFGSLVNFGLSLARNIVIKLTK